MMAERGIDRRVARAILVVVGCMLCQMGAGFFYASRALSADVIADLGWTRTMWSSGMAPMLIVSSISQAFVGAACVRFGVRPVIVASLLCLATSASLFGSMESMPVFYAAMMMLALANAGIGDVSIGSVITRWFARRRCLALGCAMAGSNIGSIVYLGALALMLDGSGWRTASFAVGLGGIAVILPVALLTVRDPGPGEGAAHEGSFEESGAADEDAMPIREILRQRSFWILFYSLFCYSLVQLGLVDQFVLYLGDLGYSREEAYAAFSLTFGAGIAAKVGSGMIGQFVSSKAGYLANTGLLFLSLVLVPFAGNPIVLTAFSLCFGFAVASRDVFLPLAVADAFGTRSFARVYGLMMLAFVPGGALGPVVLAEAHRVFGDYRPGFMACIALVLFAATAIALLPRHPTSARAVA